jgi:hypothetical protein
MIERGCSLGFALKTALGGGIHESIGEEFHRNGAIQPGVECPIHHANAALTQKRFDAVRPNISPESVEPGSAIVRVSGSASVRRLSFGARHP